MIAVIGVAVYFLYPFIISVCRFVTNDKLVTSSLDEAKRNPGGIAMNPGLNGIRDDQRGVGYFKRCFPYSAGVAYGLRFWFDRINDQRLELVG